MTISINRVARIVVPALALTLALWTVVSLPPNIRQTDFLTLYTAILHPELIYSPGAFAAAQKVVAAPYVPVYPLRAQYLYTPLVPWLFFFLRWVPYPAAFAFFVGSGVLALLLALRTARFSGWWLALLAFLPFWTAVYQGQTDLLAAALATWLLFGRAPAGRALALTGCLFLKPHLFFAVWLLLFATDRPLRIWLPVWLAVVGGALQLCHPGWLGQYVPLAFGLTRVDYPSMWPEQMHSLINYLRFPAAKLILLGAQLAVLPILIWLRRQRPELPVLPLMLVLALALAPHLNLHSILLVFPVLAARLRTPADWLPHLLLPVTNLAVFAALGLYLTPAYLVAVAAWLYRSPAEANSKIEQGE